MVAAPIDGNTRPGSLSRLLGYGALLAVLVGAGYAFLRPPAGGTPVGDDEAALLEAAIRVQWGDREPSVTSYSTTTRHGDAEEGTDALLCTTIGQDGRYREERVWNTYGITEVFAVDAEGEAWASFDATVVPLTEIEVERRKLQPWLFQVSQLAPLRDVERFRLNHEGRHELTDGRAVERLKVTSLEASSVELVLDFDAETRLLAEVTLLDDAREGVMRVRLADYRDVDGIQVAHELVSLRDDVPVATQRVVGVTIDKEIDNGIFECPTDLNRDTIIEKQSMGGLVAHARHEGDAGDIDQTLRSLRSWIDESGLGIAGPLVYVPDTGGESQSSHVYIAVTRLDEEKKPVVDEDVELTTLAPKRALCLTHVGETASEELVARLAEEARQRGLTPTGEPMEIFFSPDRRTRQIQITVE